MAKLTSVNPATLEVSGEVETTDPSEIEGLVQQSRSVQRTWDGYTRREKLACLKALRMKLIDDADRIALTVHSDTGPV